MALYHVTFSRDLGSDLEVIEKKGWPTTVKSFTDQLAEEFALHLNVDGLSLRMGRTYIKNDDGSYTLEGFFDVPQETVERGDEHAWEKRLSLLHNFVAEIQSAYDDGVAGHFEVVSVQHGRSTFPATEIVERARQSRLTKGVDLLDLTADEVLDRTKKQDGDVAMITSGEFEANGIHTNRTAYAVGTIDEDGLFHPILSNLRYGTAGDLFEKTIKAAAENKNASGL